MVGYKLAKPTVVRAAYRQGASQFVPFVVTVVAVVVSDLLTGIGIGMAVALLFILHRNYQNSHFLHLQRASSSEHPQMIVMTLAEEVTFLNKGAIRSELARLPEDCHVVIDASRSYAIDHDVQEIIDDFRDTAAERRITVDYKAPTRVADERWSDGSIA